MNTFLVRTEEGPVAAPECQALVERIAASVELRRAARLRAFLMYVCEQSVKHGKPVIHEQEIGEAVFGRPAEYDTSIDNIVRVNATELRKRLEHYFASEGSAEDIVLEIQRGSYAPTFRRRVAAGEIAAAQDSSATVQEPSSTLAGAVAAGEESAESAAGVEARTPDAGRRRLRLWQTAALMLLAGCLALSWQVHQLTLKVQPWTREPALRAFWSEFFNSGNDTDILLADTSFALAEDMMQRKIALPDYLNYDYKRLAEAPELSEAQRSDLAMVLERNNGSIADFRVGQQILALDSGQHRFNLAFAREYTPEEAKHDSLVLIGSRQSNPWVSLFADRLNFDLEYDSVLRRPYVVNRAPRPGEAASYPADNRDAAGMGYAVIAFLPDLSGKGRTLILEGSDSQATGAAGDFITSEDALAQLEQKFPAHRIPFFEVLLRTVQLSGTPMRGEVVAYRIYPASGSGGLR